MLLIFYLFESTVIVIKLPLKDFGEYVTIKVIKVYNINNYQTLRFKTETLIR